ncbi:MAG: hypothetical protein DLM67_20175 [Candidatus Nephthysia bennettiae]|nr:MAG: hypothetical protein DLM67_20175 [Candidatus Dormibacteraeota bacterium]
MPAGHSDAGRASTITDVAARTGLSESTIGRVLKGSTVVSEVTRQRVQAAIEELETGGRGRSWTTAPAEREGKEPAPGSPPSAPWRLGQGWLRRRSPGCSTAAPW